MFYLFIVLVAFCSLAMYPHFRSGIYSYLRLSGRSKNHIRKSRRGAVNYWLYRALHKEKSLGILYCLNLVYLVTAVVFFLLAVSLGHLMMLQPFFLVFSILISLLDIPCTVSASVYNCILDCGRPFVLWTRDKSGRRRCSLRDWILAFVPAVLTVLAFRYMG